MPAGGEAQAADDADTEAPAAKRRKGRKGKKVAARPAEPASSPGALDARMQLVPCRQKRVCMHACAHSLGKEDGSRHCRAEMPVTVMPWILHEAVQRALLSCQEIGCADSH